MSLAKKRKANLPKNWIVVNSTSLPDRVYYFNVRTGKSSWEEPSSDTDQAEPKTASGQKHKLSVVDDEAEIPAVRESNIKGSESGKMPKRKMVFVKRSKEAEKVLETPQMIALRKKMLDRKGKPAISERKKSGGSSGGGAAIAATPTNNKKVPSSPVDKRGKSGGQNFQGRYQKSRVGGDGGASTSGKQLANAQGSGRRPHEASVTSEALRGSRVSRRRGKEKRDDSKPGVSNKNVIPKKNLAKKRLDGLNKILSVERRKIEPLITEKLKPNNLTAKKRDGIICHSVVNVVNNLERPLTPTEPLPNIYENSESRYESLRARLASRSSSSNIDIGEAEEPTSSKLPRIPKKSNKTVEKTVQETANVVATEEETIGGNHHPAENPFSDSFFEEMEWEPIEEEKVVVEIQEVRTHLSSDQGSTDQKLPGYAVNGLQLSRALPNADEQPVYVVVDTNVFLSNLKAVTELLEDSPKSQGCRPVVVVPWMVLQELDYIKDNKSRTKSSQLQRSAKTAVDFLFEHFTSKHPRLQGQTAADAASNRIKYQVESPDDEILQSCLQIQESRCKVVLLSNDKNLCNKAIVHNVQTYRSHESIKEAFIPIATKVERPAGGLVIETRSEPSKVSSSSENRLNKTSEKEAEISDDIFGEAKAIVKNFLSTIVSKEMEKLYGENWEKYTIVQPPWSVTDVLKCVSKHWIAAVGDVFLRQAEPRVKTLSEMFLNAPKYGQSLKNIREMLEVCHDLPQMINSDEYRKLSEDTCRDIKELIDTCQRSLKELDNDKIIGVINSENKNLNDEQKANNAFAYFEQIWTFTNNFCGMAADLLGIPHSVIYKNFQPAPTPETINQLQPDLVLRLQLLITALRRVLNEEGNLTPSHPALIELYHSLTNYLPNSGEFNDSRILDLIDLLCCINVKKEFLQTGLVQLQELNYQFCRLADFRSTTANVLN